MTSLCTTLSLRTVLEMPGQGRMLHSTLCFPLHLQTTALIYIQVQTNNCQLILCLVLSPVNKCFQEVNSPYKVANYRDMCGVSRPKWYELIPKVQINYCEILPHYHQTPNWWKMTSNFLCGVIAFGWFKGHCTAAIFSGIVNKNERPYLSFFPSIQSGRTELGSNLSKFDFWPQILTIQMCRLPVT